MSTKKWIILFLILLILSSVAAFGVHQYRESGLVAVIRVDDKEVRRIDLSKVDAPYTFTIEGEDGWNEISVAHNKIEVTDASCPDKLCVKHGTLKSRYSPIVCLPHHLVITFSDETTTSVDAISQ